MWNGASGRLSTGQVWGMSLEENCALAANQLVDCRAATIFTIGINSTMV